MLLLLVTNYVQQELNQHQVKQVRQTFQKVLRLLLEFQQLLAILYKTLLLQNQQETVQLKLQQDQQVMQVQVLRQKTYLEKFMITLIGV
jgi:hypothetical protein